MTTSVTRVTAEYVKDGHLHILQDKHIPEYVTVFRIHGPFLFGTTDQLAVVADQIESLTPIVILRLRNMTAIDATGLLTLEELADKLHATGRALILCGARPQPARLLHQADFSRHVGRDNVCPHIEAALQRRDNSVTVKNRQRQRSNRAEWMRQRAFSAQPIMRTGGNPVGREKPK